MFTGGNLGDGEVFTHMLERGKEYKALHGKKAE